MKNLNKLFKTCKECKGTADLGTRYCSDRYCQGHTRECSNCLDVGFLPTKEGKLVLKLVKNFLDKESFYDDDE